MWVLGFYLEPSEKDTNREQIRIIIIIFLKFFSIIKEKKHAMTKEITEIVQLQGYNSM